jgi:septum site-determining protein MinC
MSVVQAARPSAVFDLRSAALTLVAFALKTADLAAVENELAARFGNADPFDGDPVAIDLAQVSAAPDPIDFPALMALLRRYHLAPIVARGGNADQMAAARAAGLVEASVPAVRPAAGDDAAAGSKAAHEEPGGEAAADPGAGTAAQPDEGASTVAQPDPGAGAAPPPLAPATTIVDKPLRSGQRVYARGDLVVLALVSFGAEVIADGNVHVYAPLRGRAIAGALGNTAARIFTVCLEAQLISIAGIYRSGDGAVPAELRGKPAQVWLQGEKLVLEGLRY